MSANLPSISILVPVYGVERYIERCAASLLEQDYPNIEYIFVDDCTPDRSMELLRGIIEQYPDRKDSVHLLRNDSNRGLSATRNAALRAATGEYVMHVDSDDYLTERTAVSQVMETARKENADIVLFDMLHVFPEKAVKSTQRFCRDPHELARKIIRREAAPCLCGGAYLRSLYTKHNILAIEGLDMGEDYATKPRLLYHARTVCHLPHPLYGYTHTNTESYTRTFKAKSVADLQQALATLTAFFEQTPEAGTFRPAIHLGHLRTQALATLSWGVADSTDTAFEAIRAIHSPYSLPANGLPLQDRLLLWLGKMGMKRIIRLYTRTGLRVKQYFKRPARTCKASSVSCPAGHNI